VKRFLVIGGVVVIGALALLFIFQQRNSHDVFGVAGLLPENTALLLHIPDAEKARGDWQQTDLFQLYHEPAVQDFLRTAKAELRARGEVSDVLRDSAVLRLRDIFIATSSIDPLRLAGGFEFRAGEAESHRLIEAWKNRWLGANAMHDKVEYQKHAIEITTTPRLTLASTFVGHRFFAATSVDDLKTLLDRFDGRSKSSRLSAEGNFRTAMRQMPSGYAALLYVQPQMFARKFAALRAEARRVPALAGETSQIRSFSHALVFEGAKLREVDFIRMPRTGDRKLARDTLASVPADALLFVAAVVNWQSQFANTESRKRMLGAADLSPADVAAAFDDQVSIRAKWPPSARLPAVSLAVPVRDAARARQVTAALAAASGWESNVQGNFQVFAAPPSGLALMRLVAALSDKKLAFAFDVPTAERAAASAAAANSLAAAANFKQMSGLVPPAQTLFAWLDLGTLYSRLDATLRPLLQISAAFLPERSQPFDVARLPAAAVVAKHLGTVIASQMYVDEGYRLESVGSITFDQAALVAAGAYAGSAIFGKKGPWSAHSGVVPVPASPAPTP